MAPTLPRITPCLWFDSDAEPAAQMYCAIFPASKITAVSRYGEAGREIHGRAPGSAMMVTFDLAGQSFMALNGGPVFKFTEAVSLVIHCDTQAEIDHYWSALGAGGDPAAQQCGWLKDRYGLSWQVVPRIIGDLMMGPAADRVISAVLQMKKIDVAALEAAAR
jgi:predicted 3-demethylubiquinone-9 3-methyltransferase (glyoxalase superfamily)